jgi:hypothetical protein
MLQSDASAKLHSYFAHLVICVLFIRVCFRVWPSAFRCVHNFCGFFVTYSSRRLAALASGSYVADFSAA